MEGELRAVVVEEVAGQGGVDGAVAEDVGPVVRQNLGGVDGVDVVVVVVGGHDVRNGELRALGGPKDNPRLEAGLVFGGERVVIEGVEGGISGGDGGLGQMIVEKVNVVGVKVVVEETAKGGNGVESTMDEMTLPKKSAPVRMESPVGDLLGRLHGTSDGKGHRGLGGCLEDEFSVAMSFMRVFNKTPTFFQEAGAVFKEMRMIGDP